MELREKLRIAWENRHQIAEGFYNKYLSLDPDIRAEAARRKQICESNQCGHYDKDGKPENSILPGKPSCDICHCNIDIKVNCMQCWCALRDIQQPELWSPVITEEQEKHIAEIRYQEQFNKPTNNQ